MRVKYGKNCYIKVYVRDILHSIVAAVFIVVASVAAIVPQWEWTSIVIIAVVTPKHIMKYYCTKKSDSLTVQLKRFNIRF